MKKIPYCCLKYNLISLMLLSMININTIKNNSLEAFLDFNVNSSTTDYTHYWLRFENQLKKVINYENHSSYYINFVKEVPIVNSNQIVFYIDFISKDGYIVLDDNHIYDYGYDRDLTILETIDFEYDYIDKFVYRDENNILQKIYDDKLENAICNSIPEDVCVYYGGQSSAGDGEIYDLDAYVSSRYPSYTLVDRAYIRGYNWINQSDTSFYYKYHYNGGLTISNGEGNCGLNAAYSMLSNLPTTQAPYLHRWKYNQNFLNGKNGIDYSTAIHDDSLYSTYGTGTTSATINYDGNSYTAYWTRNNELLSYDYTKIAISSIPKLYADLRNYAVSKNYYTVSGITSRNLLSTLGYIDSLYGYDINFYRTSVSADIVNNIYYGIPSLIYFSGSETYGDHAMAVYGFSKYKYTIGSITNYIYFWAVDSGCGPTYYSSERDYFMDEDGNLVNWFDPCHSDNIGFIVMERDSLTWPIC